MKVNRYNYYFSYRKGESSHPYELVTKRELVDKLSYYVVKIVCDTPLGAVTTPDYAKIESIIRQVQKGTLYNMLFDNMSISIRAELKRGDK